MIWTSPYDIAPGKLYIKGKKSGKKLKMGDGVRVRIEDVDLDRRRIDMSLVDVLQVHGEGTDKREEERACPPQPAEYAKEVFGG